MGRKRGLVAAGIGLALLAVTGLKGRVRRYAIAERSMSPTLREGDWVFATKVSGTPRRGDIVVFRHPDDRDFELVKRVVGLPGEQVTIANGQVHVDGEVLAEPWADGPALPDGEWSLGVDRIFVLGDARSLSVADSRHLGAISIARGFWKVGMRYWPPTSIKRL